MQIELINNILFEKTKAFQNPVLKRRWEIIMMVEEGSCTVWQDGKKKPYTLFQNEIAYIPSNTVIRRSVSEPISYYHIAFYSQADHPFRLCMPSGKLSLPPAQAAAIFESMRHAYRLANNREPVTHLIEHIFSENYLFGKSKNMNFKAVSDDVREAINYMNGNLSRRINMDELASRVYLSHSGLIWKFRQEIGTTPSKYLIHLRLRYAKHLLLSSNDSIAQISERCGYSGSFYFTKAFHAYTGMSPTEFRAHHLRAADEK